MVTKNSLFSVHDWYYIGTLQGVSSSLQRTMGFLIELV